MTPRTLDIGGDYEEAIGQLHALGLTDGLPVLLPTRERVDRLLRVVDEPPETVLAHIPLSWGEATLGKVATNAAMAGCPPEAFPVVVSAIRVLEEERLNFYGFSGANNMIGQILLIINGPIRQRLGISSGYNVYGQTNPVNAAIARSVRLSVINIGGGAHAEIGGEPGRPPTRQALCIGELEEKSPWEPLHVERGFAPEDSAVTVLLSYGMVNLAEVNREPEPLMGRLAIAMRTGANDYFAGGEPGVFLNPECANAIARGFSKVQVKRFLFERLALRYDSFTPEGHHMMIRDREDIKNPQPDTLVYPARKPEDIVILVTGWEGGHNVLMNSWGFYKSVTRAID